MLGNQTVIRLMSTPQPALQTKLEVNQPGDKYEQEADRVAEQVMRMPDSAVAPVSGQGEISHSVQRKCGCNGTGQKCAQCSDKEAGQNKLYRRAASAQGNIAPTEAPPIVHQVLNSPGQPLDASTRAFVEPRFGYDFSDVRVHTGSAAAESAKSIQALAYTSGNHVVFGAGQHTGSAAGRKLLAHELSHVVQQGGAKQQSHSSSRNIPELRKPAGGLRQVHRQTIPGGNILYVGMNNYKPEVERLSSIYRGKPVTLTTVTVTEEESKTQVGANIFDLTTDAGIKSYVDSLSLANNADADKLKTVIGAQGSSDRDDLVHVIAIYAKTDADGVDRMSRVVLSGHSYGSLIYNEDAKGRIQFDALVTLQGIFPKAAAQTRHLLVLACLAGEQDTIKNYYLKAFPNLRTFWGWTRATCPTGAGAADALEKWSRITDKNPSEMPLPPEHQATWASGNYQTNDPVDAKALMSQIRGDESTFNQYFSGDKTDSDAHSGFLFEYYQRARTAALHTSEITGTDHDYVQLHADQSYRLRFWPGMVSNFWKNFVAAIQAGYGSAKPPDYAHLSRKDAMTAIAGFSAASTATDKTAMTKAQQLLDALKSLDANVLRGDWIKA